MIKYVNCRRATNEAARMETIPKPGHMSQVHHDSRAEREPVWYRLCGLGDGENPSF